MRTMLLVTIAGASLIGPVAPASAQFDCPGYRPGRCQQSWMSQIAYFRKLGRSPDAGRHLVLLELGPRWYLSRRRTAAGAAVVIGIDDDGHSRLGGKLRGSRSVGIMEFELALGALLLDSRSALDPKPTIQLSLTFLERFQAHGKLDVVRLNASESSAIWYVGFGFRRAAERIPTAHWAIALGATVVAIVLDSRK